MIHIVPKWRIELYSEEMGLTTIYISDDHCSNILRKLADIEFDFKPNRIDIKLLKFGE